MLGYHYQFSLLKRLEFENPFIAFKTIKILELDMDEEFTEEKMHQKLWDYLTEFHDQDCFVKNWRGWSYRVSKEQREKTFFYR